MKPATGVRLIHAQVDLDLPRFQKMFVDLITSTGANSWTALENSREVQYAQESILEQASW